MMRANKILGIFIIIGILALSLSACSDSPAAAQEGFDGIMAALKSGDKDRIEEVYSFSEISHFAEEADGELLRDAIISTLSKLEYKVNSAEKVNSNAVRLNVELTTVDFSEIVKNYIDDVVKTVGSEDYQAEISKMSESEYQRLMSQKMIEIIEKKSDKTKTTTLDVTMTKSGDRWKIGDGSDELFGVLFANLSNAVEAIM